MQVGAKLRRTLAAAALQGAPVNRTGRLWRKAGQAGYQPAAECHSAPQKAGAAGEELAA